MKIRTKIIVYFLIAFSVVVGIAAGIVGQLNTMALKKLYLQNVQGVFEMRTDQIRRFVNDQKELITIMSQEDGFQQFFLTGGTSSEYIKDSQALLSTYLREDSNFNEVFLVGLKGKVVLSSNIDRIGENKKDDPYFINGLKGPYFKDVYLSSTTKENDYALSAPIIDSKTGKVLGVIVARVKPDRLFSILTDRSGLEQTGETFLINRDLFFLTPSLFLGERVILKQKAELEDSSICFDPKEISKSKNLPIGSHSYDPITLETDYRGVNVYETHIYIPETGSCLIAKINQSEVYAPIIRQAIVSAVGYSIGAFIFVLIGLFLSRIITKSIETLRKGVEIVEKGNLDYKVGINSKDEMGQLSRAFDQMVEGVKNSRRDVDRKVEEQTKEIVEKNKNVEDQKKAILNILEDVEEEKDKVSGEKDKIDAILHSIGDGVFVVDKDLKIVLMNNIASDLCGGYKPEDAVGKNYFDIFKFVFEDKKDKINDSFVKDAISTGKPKEMANHTILLRPDGTSIAVADRAAPLKDKKGEVIGCVVVFRDVTKEREVDRAKTEFVSLASHQLRTPLSTIKWYVELLLGGDAGKLTTEQKKYLNVVDEGNHRMISLVNSLLNVSRLEVGTFVVEPKLLDVVKLAKDVVEEQVQNVKERKLVLKEIFAEDLPKINADPSLLRMIFQNLLSNSIKYTPEKGKINFSIKKKEDQVLISVGDTGYGIPKNQQGKIFTKLFRADNIRVKDTDGTGLGLYIVKSIVDHSNGKIWFESEENKGTTFYVSLPLSGMKKKEGTKTLS